MSLHPSSDHKQQPIPAQHSPSICEAARRVATIDAPNLAFPEGTRAMARRDALPVSSAEEGAATVLRWPDAKVLRGAGKLRITAAVDARVPHEIAVSNARTGERFGMIEVLFACPGQVYGLDLTAQQIADALRDGLALQVVNGVSPFWLIAPGPNAPDAVLPHLIGECGPPALSHFLDLFCSPASIQPCDWMGVCVLDGLNDWARLGSTDAAQALEDQLTGYFHPTLGRREGAKGNPHDGKPGGPESTGPFALLAMLWPDHPALALAETGFVESFSEATQSVGHRVVAETSYNIAYPMMALAVYSGKEEYFAKAIHQLEVNRQYLTEEDALWLRYFPETCEKTFRSWSRGVAWYYLGLVRTLALLKPGDRPASLLAEVERVAAWVTRRQSQDGLWPCHFDEPEVLPDTSGCAGTAAALALGVRTGMLDRAYLKVALKTYNGLVEQYLDADGWLRGVSQSNKQQTHSYDIQRNRFRVIAPWGMGLFAQLSAALYEERMLDEQLPGHPRG